MKSHTHRFRVAKTTTRSVNTISTEHYLHAEAHTQACSRCRRMKKKCSKTPPECELCVQGGHVCSLAVVQDNANQIESPDTIVIGSTISPDGSNHDTAQVSSPHNAGRQVQNEVTASTFDGTYLSYVHAYFRHVHRAYPFLDRREILRDAKASAYLNLWAEDNPDSIILGLVLAIGSTTLARAGKLAAYDQPTMVVPYSRILSRCLLSPSEKGLQILTLLSLYSLFDPEGISTWSIVGILTQQAVALGLSRTNTSVEGLSPRHDELRHRLFWSIFVLDRMLAVSVGHRAGLIDENMNIPQPAVTVEEFASSERTEHASVLQLNRHIVQLRQLEYQIMTSIHTKKDFDISQMTNADRAATSRKLRAAIDDWYSLGCLVCLPEADNIPIHSTITWLNARYYNLLILLYYPCHFNSHSKKTSAGEIVEYTRKYFRYNHILLENKQLPLNYITLNRLIPACLVLIHCFMAQSCDFNAKSELTHCIDILRAFPESWLHAHQTATVVTGFLSVVASYETYAGAQVINMAYPDPAALSSTIRAELQRLRDELCRIVAKSLSPSSCYLTLCDWDDSSASCAALSSSGAGTEGATEQVTLWSCANDYDFGFL